ncbi:CAP domain-containing protein [Pseudarthrobacter sp. So.54]
MKLRSTRATAVVFGLLLSLSGGLLGASASTAAPVKAGMPSSAYSDTFAKKTHNLINAERAKVGARPLAWNQRIANVSQDWANRLGVATKDPGFDFGRIHRPDAAWLPDTFRRHNVPRDCGLQLHPGADRRLVDGLPLAQGCNAGFTTHC